MMLQGELGAKQGNLIVDGDELSAIQTADALQGSLFAALLIEALEYFVKGYERHQQVCFIFNGWSKESSIPPVGKLFQPAA